MNESLLIIGCLFLFLVILYFSLRCLALRYIKHNKSSLLAIKIDKHIAIGMFFTFSLFGIIALMLWHFLGTYTSLNYIVVLVIISIIGSVTLASIERVAMGTKYEKYFPKNT